MPANTTPIFILTPNMGTARITAATTASDGSGTLFSLLTAGASGSRVDAVRFRNSAVTTGSASTGMVHKIFYSATNTAGSATCRLVGEVSTTSATRATTVIGASSLYTFDLPLIMPSGSGLFVGQSIYAGAVDQFDAQAFAGDY